MPRRPYKKRNVKPDIIYSSYEVAKLITYVMKDGKKSVAEHIIYTIIETMKKNKLNPLEVIHKAIENTAPQFEVKPKRVGGASYLVPIETRSSRKIFLAFNWIIKAAYNRSSKEYRTFDKKLYAELMDAYQGQGEAINKRKQVEKLAEANRAFAHFKW
ncbi:MAG TPA: 30S ribosomal protein S7 [Patescibacteria group bacterium]|nr:30S ribosomal protein S7 [Patescibacteria group bacterium]